MGPNRLQAGNIEEGLSLRLLIATQFYNVYDCTSSRREHKAMSVSHPGDAHLHVNSNVIHHHVNRAIYYTAIIVIIRRTEMISYRIKQHKHVLYLGLLN